jgi:hypothetical protein
MVLAIRILNLDKIIVIVDFGLDRRTKAGCGLAEAFWDDLSAAVSDLLAVSTEFGDAARFED